MMNYYWVLKRTNKNIVIDYNFSNRNVKFGKGRDACYDLVDTTKGYVLAGTISLDALGEKFNGSVRINKITGALDETYGIDGKIILGSGSSSILLSENDSVYFFGSHKIRKNNDTNSNLLESIVKLDSNGALATDFGTDIIGKFDGKGLVYQNLDFRGVNDEFFSGIISGTDIVACGLSNPNKISAHGTPFNFSISKFNKNGTFDEKFGVNGRLIIDITNGSNDKANSIIELKNNYIIGGSTNNLINGVLPNNLPFYFALVKINKDGDVDKKFGKYTQQPYNNLSLSLGKVVHGFGTFVEPTNSIIIKLIPFDNNSFIALGRHGNNVVTNNNNLLIKQFIIAKYDDDGKLDVSFGTNGVTIVGYNNQVLELQGGAIDTVTNYIYAVGSTINPTGEDSPVIMRFNPSGQLDPLFNTLSTTPGIYILTSAETGHFASYFRSAIVERNGDLVVCGEGRAQIASSPSSFFVMKFNEI